MECTGRDCRGHRCQVLPASAHLPPPAGRRPPPHPFRIFLASPGDVRHERAIVREVVEPGTAAPDAANATGGADAVAPAGGADGTTAIAAPGGQIVEPAALEQVCPGVSRDMVRHVLREQQEQGLV